MTIWVCLKQALCICARICPWASMCVITRLRASYLRSDNSTSPAKESELQASQPECHNHGIQRGLPWAVAANMNARTETVSLWNKIGLIWQIRRLMTKVEDIPIAIPDHMYFPWLYSSLMLGRNSEVTMRSLPPSRLDNIRCLSSPWFLNT